MATRVFLINDSTSNPNWGDRAAALSLKKLIRSNGGRIVASLTEDQLIDFDFGFEEATESTGPAGDPSGFKSLIKSVAPPIIWRAAASLYYTGASSSQAAVVPTNWGDYERYVAKFRKTEMYSWLHSQCESTDVVIIHGNGGILGGDYVGNSVLYLAWVIKTCFETPIALVNHTADLDTPEIRRIAEDVYPVLDDIVYRDEISAELWGPVLGGDYGADTAFRITPVSTPTWPAIAGRDSYFSVWPDSADFNPAAPYVCIGGSSIHSFDPRFLPGSLLDGYRKLVSSIRKNYGGQVVVTISDQKDQFLFRPLASELELPVIALTTPVQQAVDVIGNAQAYVGGRWHPSIFALNGGVPVVPISSKTHKMKALCQSAGLPGRVFDATSLSAEVDQITERLTQAVEEGETLRRSLRLWSSEQREIATRNVAIMDSIVSGDRKLNT